MYFSSKIFIKMPLENEWTKKNERDRDGTWLFLNSEHSS